jgi:F-type H+-transporting ATPase subunit a
MSLIFIFAYTQGTGVATGVGIFSCLFSLFMQVLEVLVAFLQAYVFTLLSSVFIGLSQIEEHHA